MIKIPKNFDCGVFIESVALALNRGQSETTQKKNTPNTRIHAEIDDMSMHKIHTRLRNLVWGMLKNHPPQRDSILETNN